MNILTKEYRGSILENIHYGWISIVDENQKEIYHVGDTNCMTYYRSSAKPLQAIPVIKSGILEKYGFSEHEITILAGSHAGEFIHLQTIESMLNKIGYREEDLIMNPTYPAAESIREEMIRNHQCPRKALHNCSGKHIGIILLQEALGEKRTEYWKMDAPAQKVILETLHELSGYDNKIEVSIDGCGVPVFAVPLKNIAISYLKLGSPHLISDEKTRDAVKKITSLMNKYPLMVRGTNYLCSLMNMDTNIVAKGGAQGIYAFALKKEHLGIAFKIADGSETPWPYVIAQILRQLNYDKKETIKMLAHLSPGVIFNDNHQRVGFVKTDFRLEKTE